MLFDPDRAERLARITDHLNVADPATDDLFLAAAAASHRLTAAGQGRCATEVRNLINAGARTDAAIALMTMGLPRWKLRRLAYDEGEWHCAISCQRDLPDWLDPAIEARHADLSTAILKGVVEAMRQDQIGQDACESKPTPGRVDLKDLLCCDNFS